MNTSQTCTTLPNYVVDGKKKKKSQQFALVTKKANGILGHIKKKRGQQVKGDSLPPLLCPCEATSGALCLVLGSPVQERQGTKKSPVEGHKED